MKPFVITLAFALSAMAFGQDRISVKDFGAKGDGIADDTAAIQKALDAFCGDKFRIASVTGEGVSPIVVITSTPHTFLNGSRVVVTGVEGNTGANGRWSAVVLSPAAIALYTDNGETSTGNAAYTSGGAISAPLAASLYFPSGTYNISSPLVTRCAMSILGDGPTASVIFQTHQYTFMHGIVANYGLRMEDIAVNTTPLTVNYGMIGVFGGTSIAAAPMLGYKFSFERFASHGFNFGLDINGTSETDLVASITVDQSDISVGTEINAVSQPINAANAAFLTVKNSMLTGDSVPGGEVRNDHAIYTIAIRGVLIQNNVIQNHGNSAIKLLQGGFHDTVCPTNQDYTSWTIDNNRITGSRLAIAVYSFCDLVMPSVVFSNNTISDIQNNYLGDYAAVYVQANCRSNMQEVMSRGNTYAGLGLGGIVLASQVQGDKTCTAPEAQGTISNFTSSSDTFANWSIAAPGTFPAINSTGQNLIHATISWLSTSDENGSLPLNLSAFAEVTTKQLNRDSYGAVAVASAALTARLDLSIRGITTRYHQIIAPVMNIIAGANPNKAHVAFVAWSQTPGPLHGIPIPLIRPKCRNASQ